MATKIQVRRGNAAAVPALDTAEIGYGIDTKNFFVGDGTSNPPRIATTKSTGSFSYPNVTLFEFPKIVLGLGANTNTSIYFNLSDPGTGLFSPGAQQVGVAVNSTTRFLVNNTGVSITGDVAVSANGKVDTVDISLLNPSNVNGIMVKVGDNNYGFRTLIPGAGIASFTNETGSPNAGGGAGNIVIALANNPSIPGTGAIKIPAGTTGERSGVSPVDGHFRYNNSTKTFEGRVDGEWREFVDFIVNKTVRVPSQFPSIQDAINYFDNRLTRDTVNIELDVGVITVNTQISPSSRANKININGQAPVVVQLDPSQPVLSVSGTAGNWLVTYKLAAAVPAGITTDHCISISNIEGLGDYPSVDGVLGNRIARVNANALNELNLVDTSANINDIYSVGDYVMITSDSFPTVVRRIQALPTTSKATLDSNVPGASTQAGTMRHRRLRALTGNFSASNSTSLTGTGSSLLTELNVGDIVFSPSSGDYARVEAINSNTSATLNVGLTVNNGVLLQITAAEMHQGVWKISAIDAISNTVTVVNTSRSIFAPPRFGIRRGAINLYRSIINFTSNRLFSVNSGEYLGMQNFAARYTGSNPTSGSIVALNANASNLLIRNVGFSTANVNLTQGTVLDYDLLFVSDVRSSNTAFVAYAGSYAQGTRLIVNGNNAVGVSVLHNSSLLNHAFVSICGNGRFGLMVNSNSYAEAGILSRVSGNLFDAMQAVGSSTLDMDSAKIVNNNPVGSGRSILAAANSTLIVTGNNFFAANRIGVQVANSSYGQMNNVVLAAMTSAYAIASENGSTLILNSVLARNCLRGLSVHAGILYMANCSVQRILENGMSPLHAVNSSVVIMVNTEILKASNQPYDISAWNSTNVILGSTGNRGSGNGNAFVANPPVNGSGGNRQSFVYNA